MRSALILPILASITLVSACGDKADAPAGSERRSAAGEVLGGEVSDAMLPLDTARSTSPAGVHAAMEDEDGQPRQAANMPAPATAAEPTPDAAPAAAPVAPAPVEPTAG